MSIPPRVSFVFISTASYNIFMTEKLDVLTICIVPKKSNIMANLRSNRCEYSLIFIKTALTNET